MKLVTLAEVSDHVPFRVTTVHDGAMEATRLADLGFLPGTTVTRVGQAPFGDPIIVAVRGTRFALRKQDARQIVGEYCPPDAPRL